MKVLTFSRQFPKGHPRAGDSTFFVEKMLASLGYELKTVPGHLLPLVNDFQMMLEPGDKKAHTIRAGERFKVGDQVSLRVWSDKPYRSKQVEFAQVEIKKVFNIDTDGILWWINGQPAPSYVLTKVALNDGLSLEDFYCWFDCHPKKEGSGFSGQIICWDENINY